MHFVEKDDFMRAPRSDSTFLFLFCCKALQNIHDPSLGKMATVLVRKYVRKRLYCSMFLCEILSSQCPVQ